MAHSQSFTPYRKAGDDLKFEITTLTMEIIRGGKTALISNQKYNEDLIAWGGMIETFDAFIGIYYQKDELYYDARKQIQDLVSSTNIFDTTTKNRLHLKRLYDYWFRLICIKLTVFKIFPPLPVEYAQGIGEITEAVRLLKEKRGISNDE